MCLVISEALHLGVFVCRLHFPVHLAYFVLREGLTDFLVASFEIFHIEFLCLFYERIDNVYLPAKGEFATHHLVDSRSMSVELMDGFDWFASRR